MLPTNEKEEKSRLDALYALRMLHTGRDEAFDRLTRVTAKALGSPFAAMSLVDRDNVVVKSALGPMPESIGREHAFCGQTVLSDDPLVVTDAHRDERFAQNPFVHTGPGLRFYAGVPLLSLDGYRLGTLCILDVKKRNFTSDDLEMLTDFAKCAQEVIQAHEIRRQNMRRFMRTYHDNIIVPR